MDYTKEVIKRIVEEIDNNLVALEKEISRLKQIKLKLDRLKDELKTLSE